LGAEIFIFILIKHIIVVTDFCVNLLTGHFTIMVQAVCNYKRKFTHVSIGYPGRVHDARAFRSSTLPEKLNSLPSGE